jgi:PAS domain S-box-containing protein
MEGDTAIDGEPHPVYEALFEGAPAGIGFWDDELRFRRINRRLAELNGLSREQHIGRRPSELLGELGRQAESVMRQVLASGTAVVEMPFSGEMPTQPGRTAHYLASFYPVADSGHTTGVGGVVVDVTERHEAAQGERFALEAAQVARARAEALARASTALTSSMRTERVLDALVRAVVPALADFCAVHLVRPDETLEAVAVAHGNPACEDLARRLADRQALDPYAPVGPAAVIRTGVREVNEVISPEALVHEGVHPDERALLADLEVRSAVILPLSARGAIVGALTLAMGDSGRRYEPDLVELVESLGAGVGLALDNARLFAEQAEVARALQRTLLPSELPYIPGALLAARYRAAGRSNQAGGDFYDVFAADEGEWALMIGDVVGKGAAAAAITSLVRATLQAAIIRGDGPDAALRLVDEALRRRPSVQFCSALHGRLRPAAGGGIDVRILAAGHPPPLIVRQEGALEAVEISGTLLGVTPEPTFGEARVHLEPGDALLLYTDGATELRGWR